MVPVCELDGVLKPTYLHSCKFSFELDECHRISRRDIDADERHSSRIVRKLILLMIRGGKETAEALSLTYLLVSSISP